MLTFDTRFVAASTKATDVATSSPTSTKRHDPGIEQRRAARLAREARQQMEAAARRRAKDNSNDAMMSATAEVFSGSPKQKGKNQIRPKKRSRRDQVQSSNSRGGTERSRVEASKPGAAETIMAFAQREAASRAAAEGRKTTSSSVQDGMLGDAELSVDPPQFIAPEPIAPNLAAVLDTVPNLTSSLPSMPPAQKLKKAPVDWVKRVFGGDYSQFQLDAQQYLKGTQGPKSTYAKIVLERNPTIPLGSQQQFLGIVRRLTREGGPNVKV